MYCPNCSTQAAAQQNYCRACGVSLDQFSELLNAMLPDQTATAEAAHVREQLRRMERGAVWVLALSGLAIYLSFLISIIKTTLIANGNLGEGILLLGLLTGALFVSLSIIHYAWLHEKLKAYQKRQPMLPVTEPTNKLLAEEQPHNVASVTEQTTAKLEEKIAG